nr:MAG TPA: Helix-turn-helix XRE-family like protein [Caudoviricetes sp.]
MSKLKERREALGLTQRQVAEKIGVKYQSYQRYESLVIIPNAQIAVKVAKALNTTVEEIYSATS